VHSTRLDAVEDLDQDDQWMSYLSHDTSFGVYEKGCDENGIADQDLEAGMDLDLWIESL